MQESCKISVRVRPGKFHRICLVRALKFNNETNKFRTIFIQICLHLISNSKLMFRDGNLTDVSKQTMPQLRPYAVTKCIFNEAIKHGVKLFKQPQEF